MDVKELMMQIERVANDVMHNVTEAEEHIECAHELREVCRLEADWHEDMAAAHVGFYSSGKQLFDKLMRDFAEMPEAAHYLMGAKPVYERWMGGIGRKLAEVQSMISMYNK